MILEVYNIFLLFTCYMNSDRNLYIMGVLSQLSLDVETSNYGKICLNKGVKDAHIYEKLVHENHI